MTAQLPNSFANPAEAFRAGVAIVGSQPKVAMLLGKSQATISRRLKDNREIWAESVQVFSDATGILKSQLRPDLFEPATVDLDPPSVFEAAR